MESEIKCQCCGTTEDVCLLETDIGICVLRKWICRECYEKSTGKYFVDMLNGESMYAKE